MHFQRVEHALARHDDLLRLLLDRETADEGRDLRGASRCPNSLKLEKETTDETATSPSKTPQRASSAVFHFANCPSLFWPAQTDVWTILRNSCPVRGLNTKIAPLMGLVVRLPSKVLWMVTR